MKLKAAMPGISQERIETHGQALLDAMAAADISTPLRQAHFLAQVGHESGDLRWLEEITSGEAYEGRRDLGNTEPGDGRRFKGRGAIQVTGRANYRALGVFVGRDLLVSPSDVASDARLATLSAAWFWTSRSLNALADKDAFVAITRSVNGGMNGLEDRRRRLAVAKAALIDAEASA